VVVAETRAVLAEQTPDTVPRHETLNPNDEPTKLLWVWLVRLQISDQRIKPTPHLEENRDALTDSSR
jgi:hypothetical protein